MSKQSCPNGIKMSDEFMKDLDDLNKKYDLIGLPLSDENNKKQYADLMDLLKKEAFERGNILLQKSLKDH